MLRQYFVLKNIKLSLENFKFPKNLSLFLKSLLEARKEKRKAVEKLVSAEIETPLAGSSQSINPVAGTSKPPKVHTENLEEMKFTLRKEILSDRAKNLVENQKEILKLIAPAAKKQPAITVQMKLTLSPRTCRQMQHH